MDPRSVAVAIGAIGAAYLIGAIPWGVVIARVVGGPDPRTMGSGRTGGANVMRALGPRVAVVAGVLDLLKGCVAVAIPELLGADILVVGLCALAAIIGHSRSIYIGFRGGRGVSPAFGALLVLWPVVALVIIPIFFVIVRFTHYSSLGSLIASALAGGVLVVLILVQGLPPAHLVYAIGGPALIWLFHWDNIQRLLTGRERTIDSRGARATAGTDAGTGGGSAAGTAGGSAAGGSAAGTAGGSAAGTAGGSAAGGSAAGGSAAGTAGGSAAGTAGGSGSGPG